MDIGYGQPLTTLFINNYGCTERPLRYRSTYNSLYEHFAKPTLSPKRHFGAFQGVDKCFLEFFVDEK